MQTSTPRKNYGTRDSGGDKAGKLQHFLELRAFYPGLDVAANRSITHQAAH